MNILANTLIVLIAGILLAGLMIAVIITEGATWAVVGTLITVLLYVVSATIILINIERNT